MPNYNVPQSGGQLTSLIPGDQVFYLFKAETLVAPQASVAFSRGAAPGTETPALMVFTISFASAPTATVSIQGSNEDIDSQYQDLQTGTTQLWSYSDLGGFAFYRAKLETYSAGGALTVTVKR